METVEKERRRERKERKNEKGQKEVVGFFPFSFSFDFLN